MAELDDASGSPWLDPVPDKPVFPRLIVYGRPGLQFYVCGTGLGVSPGGFFEDRIIQRDIRYQSLESGVLLLQFFKPLSLIHS